MFWVSSSFPSVLPDRMNKHHQLSQRRNKQTKENIITGTSPSKGSTMSKPKRPDYKSQADHAILELESVLRLRPLQKKEKTDQVVLEPRRMEDGRPVTAVMHPMLAKQKHPESPGMKMLSPETLHLCKDTEYHLNHILPDECDQEKVYYNLGLPAARESMDFLKFKKGAQGYRRTTNLIVCMGVENSGKTHTCFGSISKRRGSQAPCQE
jgi:hypothetical protein